MRAILAAFALALATPATAQGDSAAGDYTLANAFETYVGLLLREDGTYAFVLSVGALDKTSAGTWEQDGEVVTLTTDPVPTPPAFARAGPDHTIADEPDAPSLVRVTWPNDRDIPGVDIVLECSDGSNASGYTQYDGWSPESPCHSPTAITLRETMHDIGPATFALAGDATDKDASLHFILVPNDFGVMDMTGATGVLGNGELQFTFMGSTDRMVRVERRTSEE